MAQPLVALQAALPQFADPSDLQMKAYKLRDLAAQAQIADQTMADDRGARAAFAANPTDGAARLSALANVSPKAYSDELKRQADATKSGAEADAAKLKNAHDSLDLAGRAFSFVRSNPTQANANSALDFLGSKGVYTPDQVAQYKSLVASDPSQIAALADQAFRASIDTKSQLPKLETRDTGGQVQTLAIDPLTGAPRVTNTIDKTQSPDNVATNQRLTVEGAADRAARAAEGTANRANQIAVQKMIGARQDAKGDDDGTGLSDATKKRIAMQFVDAGDTSGLKNIGRGAQGAKDLRGIQNAITDYAESKGLSPTQISAKIADFEGLKVGLRTSANISARIDNAAAEAEQLAPLAIEASRKVSRSGFLPFGRMQVMFNNQTNDPDMNEFATANIGLATAYAGVLARGAKTTESDKQEARHILLEAKDQRTYEVIVAQMKREIAAAQAAPGKVREHLRGEISGKGGGHGAPADGAGKVVDFGSLK